MASICHGDTVQALSLGRQLILRRFGRLGFGLWYRDLIARIVRDGVDVRVQWKFGGGLVHFAHDAPRG